LTANPNPVPSNPPLRVPYGSTVHGEEEIAAVMHVLRTSTQMGDHVRRFQAGIAARFQKKHGIMVNSGSSANYLAVELLGLQPGAEVITPALTFATTVAPIVKSGLIPAFVDVEPDTFNIDVDQIEAMISDKTKAIMVPSLIGNLPDWDRIAEIAAKHDLFVIEDSADTLGAIQRGKSTGTRSHISTTSFYGSHVINCAGNGGMVCVNRDDWAEEATLLRSWGRSSSTFIDSEAAENRFNVNLDGIAYDAKFLFTRIGYNWEPSELGAAFGLVQLGRLEANIDARVANFAAQTEFFAQYPEWFMLPRQAPDTRTGWLAFPLIIREGAPFTRKDLQIHFETQGIQTRTVFTGNILRQPAYKEIARHESPSGYPNADRVMRSGMLIACHHGLTSEQLAHIHATFREFAAKF
jgi:CDP-6-deoxy-D-xylo-4-hexulose-3-dehydrase